MTNNEIKITKVLTEIQKGLLNNAINKVSKEGYIIVDVVGDCVMLSDEEYISIKVESIEDLVNKYNIY